MCKKIYKRVCPKRNKKLSEYVQKERTQMCKTDITRRLLCTFSSADQNRLDKTVC